MSYNKKKEPLNKNCITSLCGEDCFHNYTYNGCYEQIIRKPSNNMPGQDEDFSLHNDALLSFKDIADEWLRVQQHSIKESSYVKYKNILSLYLLPQFGKELICNIDRKSVVDYACKLLENGGANESPLSPKTASCIISVLKCIFSYVENEKIHKTVDISHMPIKVTPKEMTLLSADEQTCLTRYLLTDPAPRNLAILLSLYAGLRIGEVCALKWEDISDHHIHVHNTMQRIQTFAITGPKTKLVITEPKSVNSIRTIPLPEHLYPFYRSRRLDGSCFLVSGSSKYVEPRNLENYYKTVLRKCGIKYSNYHVLRHTFATRCVELGFDIKSLSEILGHANVNITLNRYVHPSMDLKQKNMNMLCSLLTSKPKDI